MHYNNICNHTQERAWITHPYIWWDNLFNTEELDRMSKFFTSQGTKEGTLGSGKVNSDIRVSDVKFHYVNTDTRWIFERFNAGIQTINNQFYGFELNGYDFIQYGEYHASKKGKYDWHTDMSLGAAYLERGPEFFQTRKLSLSFLLNKPGVDFEGGELELNTGNETDTITTDLTRGRIIAFPSFIPHRIKPVTKGVRKSLVIWVSGPKFK